MNCIGTYDGTIFYNPANKFCIVSVKTADQSVPAEARSNRRYKDHLIRFTAVGYEIPRTDAVELELDGEWTKGKYGVQLQVEQWREIVPRTKNGVEGYLASGLIKGIGPKTAADIVERFGVATLDILEHQPERLLEIRGITENKLEDIRASYAENRMLQGIMTLLAPFKITPKTALKIYQYFGPTSVEILEKSPFELCQIQESGIENVQILSPFRSEGAASSEQLNETIRELVNPFRSAEEEIKFGPRIFRVNDRIMQTKNTEKVSNGDLGFIRYGAQRSVAQRVRMTWKCWGVCSWTTMNICRKITEVVRWLHLMWWNWTARANAHTSM